MRIRHACRECQWLDDVRAECANPFLVTMWLEKAMSSEDPFCEARFTLRDGRIPYVSARRIGGLIECSEFQPREKPGLLKRIWEALPS